MDHMFLKEESPGRGNRKSKVSAVRMSRVAGWTV